jgi:hypothetical protein
MVWAIFRRYKLKNRGQAVAGSQVENNTEVQRSEYEMEELKSDNVDLLVYHQHNQVEQLKSVLECKKMLFSKNCIKISKVVGQGR